MNIGGDSNISAGAPSSITVVAGVGLSVNALDFDNNGAGDGTADVTDGSYTVSCGDATETVAAGESAKLSVAHTGRSCDFTVTALAEAQGSASFTVPYISSGGHTATATFRVVISNIVYTAPNPLPVVQRSEAVIIDALDYASDNSFTITCGDASDVSSNLVSVVRDADSTGGCEYTAVAGSVSGSADFTIVYTSSGGDTHTAEIGLRISSITFTAPTGLTLAAGSRFLLRAGGYATSPTETITCLDATNLDSKFASATRVGDSCVFSLAAKSNAFTDLSGVSGVSGAQGTDNRASLTIPYMGSDGSETEGTVTFVIGPVSNVVFTAPSDLKVGRNRTLVINALDYVAENSAYTVTCADATGVDSDRLESVTRSSSGETGDGCTFTVAPKGYSEANAADRLGAGFLGNTSFFVRFSSTGRDTLTGTFTVEIGPDSNVVYTAPTGLAVARNRTLVIDALAAVAENAAYTVSCADATGVSTYTDADSNVVPRMAVTRSSSGDGCSFTVDPVDDLAAGLLGDATFSVAFTSDGGASATGIFTVDIDPDFLTFTAPRGLKVATNRTQKIDALDYVAGDGTITCGDATNVGANMPTSGTVALTSVVRDASGNGCNYEITPTSTQGTAVFTVPYTSSSGSLNGNISITVGPTSTISYSSPGTLSVARNRTLVIDASGYVSDNSAYTVTCGDATGVDANRMTVTRSSSGDGCTFTVDPVDNLPATAPPGDPAAATQGDTTFAIPFTSDGGHEITRTITVNIGPDSNIVYTAPTGLEVGRNRTLVIDALDYVAETTGSNYTFTCADATGVDAARMTVTRSSSGDGCSFTVDPVNSLAAGLQGDTTFSVFFTSTGGDTATGTFTVNIGADSNIVYTAPDTLIVGRNRTLEIDASSYVADGSYTFTCSDATGVDTYEANNVQVPKMAVTHAGSSCTYTIDPVDTLLPTEQGDATFTISLASSGGDSTTRTITVGIGPDSNIAFAPPAGLVVGENRTIEFNALDYVTENEVYTVTCGDATGVDATRLTVSHTGDSCTYTLDPVDRAGSGSQGSGFGLPYNPQGGGFGLTYNPQGEDGGIGEFGGEFGGFIPLTGITEFSIPLTSSGGATRTGTVSVLIGPDSTITFNAPEDLSVQASKSIEIDASGYASDGGYTISCGDATNIDAKFASVTRSAEGGADSCSFTATANAGVLGDASFTVPYASSGGHTYDGVISVEIVRASDIVFTAPPATGRGSLTVLSGRVLLLDVADYAADGDFAISCTSAAAAAGAAITVESSGCSVAVTGGMTGGSASFTVEYMSSGGDTHTGTVALSVSRAVSGTAIPLLSNAGCTDGTFVNLTTNPRVTGPNNDLAEDCMTLVAIQNHFAGFEANRDLGEFHMFREWGDASIEWGTGTASDRLVQNWIGITVTGGRVTDFVISVASAAGELTLVSGTLPSELQNLTALERLDIDDHELSGNLPSWLGSMSALNDVNLSGNNFSGPIPSELGNLSSLQFLNLSNNELSGSIPSSLGSLSNLVRLLLNNNQLSGSIPSELGSLSSTAFRQLDLSDNRLSGSIPSQLTSLTALRPLLLDGNLLTGSIPSGIGSLTNLTILDLNNNRLSGSIPDGVGSLSSLFRLRLDDNQLTGAIPAAVGNLVTLNPAGTSFTGIVQAHICGNYFTGPVPAGLRQSTTSGRYALQDYPIAEGFNPVACQDATAVPASGNIAFAPPVVVPVQAGGDSVFFNAASYFTGSDYSATCANATGPAISAAKLTFTRSGCSYEITAPTSASRVSEDVTFNVVYTQSSAGATATNGVVKVRILPASSISFTAPDALGVAIGGTLTINALDFDNNGAGDGTADVTDGPYAITCGDATGIDSSKFNSVVRSTSGNGCSFTVTPAVTLPGSGTFTVPFASSGGGTSTGTFTVSVGTVIPTATPRLEVGRNQTRTFNALNYVREANPRTDSNPRRLHDLLR